VAVAELLSRTCTVNVLAPVALGVPVIAPVLAVSDKPAGRAPAMTDHVYGIVPEPASSIVLYTTPEVPLGNSIVVTATPGAATIMLSASEAVLEFASVTLTVKLLVPVAVGAPEITPVLAVSDKPAGKEPELIDHV